MLGIIGCGKNCKDAIYAFTMQESFSSQEDSIVVGDILLANPSHSTTFKDTIRDMNLDFVILK